MMKKILNLVVFLSLTLTFTFTFTSNIYASENINNTSNNIENNGKYLSYTYYIKKYDVAMEVTEDNVLNITETIDVFFNKSSHGIFREIPTRGYVLRNDGTSSKYRANISNISVNDNYQISNLGYGIYIKIGSASRYVNGDKTYVIKYSYKLSGEINKNFDELYYNIIGTDWDSPIEKVTFNIKMPNDFDTEKIGFTHGELDSRDISEIEYEIDGNTIIGELMKPLKPKEALTVRIELPNGYFKISKFRMFWLTVLEIIISFFAFLETIISLLVKHIKFTVCICYFICTTITFLKWIKWKNSNHIVETVEMYPPDDLNSLELGYIFKGKAISNDVTSLIIYLANKGYLKIEEDKTDFKIIRLKDYDGNNKYEKEVFRGLFKNREEVTKKDLSKSFYMTTGRIRYELNKKENREKIVIPRTKTQRRLAMIAPILIVLAMLITIVNGKGYEREVYNLLPCGVITCITLVLGINADITKRKGMVISAYNKNLEIESKVDFSGKLWFRLTLFLLAMYGFLMIVFFFMGELYLDPSYYIYILFGYVSLTLTLFFTFNIEKRTEYGNKMLGRILGFKRFLENAREDELQDLVEEHPTYFYDILPYTYVLGISDKWISKFEAINMPSPEWYKSEREDSFEFVSVTKVLDNTINSANNSRPEVTHSSSSSSSSSFSSSDRSSSSERRENRSTGGGSAGRGAGGGGGGAW